MSRVFLNRANIPTRDVQRLVRCPLKARRFSLLFCQNDPIDTHKASVLKISVIQSLALSSAKILVITTETAFR